MSAHNEFESLTLSIAKTLINIRLAESALEDLRRQKRRATQTFLRGGVLGRTMTMMQAEIAFKEGIKKTLTKHLDNLFRRRRHWLLRNQFRAKEADVRLLIEGFEKQAADAAGLTLPEADGRDWLVAQTRTDDNCLSLTNPFGYHGLPAGSVQLNDFQKMTVALSRILMEASVADYLVETLIDVRDEVLLSCARQKALPETPEIVERELASKRGILQDLKGKALYLYRRRRAWQRNHPGATPEDHARTLLLGHENRSCELLGLEFPPEDGLDVYVEEAFELHIFR